MKVGWRSWPALLLVAGICAWAGCGSVSGIFGTGPGGGTPSNGTVTVTLSDPSTCLAPNGPYTHIWISIAAVEASPNASAAAGDSSFVDLTPQLKTAPAQVDLLAPPSQCQLPTLATNTSVTAAQYAQLRVFLAADSQAGAIANNHCGAAANCVQLASNGSIQPIVAGAATTSGLPIAAATLLGGPFTVSSGQSSRINIAFDACASVLAANGQILLNAAVTGGALAQNSQVSGTLVDGVSHAAIGGRQIVALEQPGAGGADRVVLETAASNATGAFLFCAVPTGTYDLAAIASTAAGGQYAPTFLSGVTSGAQIGNVSVFPGVGINANPGTVQLTTSTGAAAAALRIAAQERIANGTQTFIATIPIPQEPAATVLALTAPGASCALGGDCSVNLFSLPALNASFGRFSGTPSPLISSNTTSPAIYQMDVQAATCSPQEQTTGDVSVLPNGSTSASVAFAGCT